MYIKQTHQTPGPFSVGAFLQAASPRTSTVEPLSRTDGEPSSRIVRGVVIGLLLSVGVWGVIAIVWHVVTG